MRIKHYAGYGCVNAKKTGKTTVKDMFGDNYTKLQVTVTGNHEWGIELNDTYDLYNWLVKRFDKTVANYNEIVKVDIKDDYIKQDGLDVEQCVYTFYYKQKN